MKPNRNFDFDVGELALVEDAMRYRVRRLIKRRETVVKDNSREKIDAELKQINQLLGKIHDQKVWFRPTDNYVSG
tara:strand:- start:73 stop:297 length:225 start_codon:yes stop_codon:yes gene_type:complete